MKEFIFMQNISNMFERYYSNEKNVKNEPLEKDEKKEFQEISNKFEKGITEECYKKYKYIKSDMLEISSKFENAIYISRKIKDNTYEPTKILKSEIKKWDYFDFKKKYNESLEKVEYFLPIYRSGILYFDLEIENPFLNQLEGILIDMTSIRNNLLQKKLFDGLKKLDDLIEEQKKYDKNILNIMGIFLAIFSIIGFGISSSLNIESNHFALCSMICGAILITMTSLFYLINFSYENIWTSIGRMIIPICIGFGLIIFGANYMKSHPSENKTAKDLETRLKIIEEKIDYEKRINELEKKTK
jgi:hypothetical protein